MESLVERGDLALSIRRVPTKLEAEIALWDKIRSFGDIKNSLSHELESEKVIKRANQWAQRSVRAKPAVRSKQMSQQCK